MARRQRPLYEFVDPDQLEADDVQPQPQESSASAAQRSRLPGRIAAGIALLGGVALFAVGVLQLGSPLSSAGRAHNPRATRSVARSVLPAAPTRRHGSAAVRRRARREPPAHPASSRRPADPLVVTSTAMTHGGSSPVSQRAPHSLMARTPARVPAGSTAASEFGFER
jgi:hypothetical protein